MSGKGQLTSVQEAALLSADKAEFNRSQVTTVYDNNNNDDND